jgi:hypothetical protein
VRDGAGRLLCQLSGPATPALFCTGPTSRQLRIEANAVELLEWAGAGVGDMVQPKGRWWRVTEHRIEYVNGTDVKGNPAVFRRLFVALVGDAGARHAGYPNPVERVPVVRAPDVAMMAAHAMAAADTAVELVARVLGGTEITG